MNLKEFLEKNKILKESALAVLMWPDKKNQAKVFSNKINEVATGKNGSKQRITENDEARAKIVLLEVAKQIEGYAGSQPIEPIVEPEAPKFEKKESKPKVSKEPTMAELFKQINNK